MPRASVLIPVHDHYGTLPIAVCSALAQTVTDVEVIIVGDGVGDRVRAVATALVADDDRVRFLDFPKGPHHGEIHRDAGIRASRSEAIFYLCDDDLLLPRHVENLLDLLSGADLVQCRNGYVTPNGSLRLYPGDLADKDQVAWLLREPRRNFVSLTGTAHRRSTYFALPRGWMTTPAGEWPDHFMWKRFFVVDGFRGATHPEMTAVQLPTSVGRELDDQDARVAELAAWVQRLSASDAHEALQELVARVCERQLAQTDQLATDRCFDLERLSGNLADAQCETLRLRAELAELAEQLQRADAQSHDATRDLLAERAARLATENHLTNILASRSWRWTMALRRLRARDDDAPR